MAEMRKRTSMSVLEMGRMLGLGKTESYWLIKKNYFKTILVGNTMRVMIDSFEEWYANQFKYQKVDGTPPGEELKKTTYSMEELGQRLGLKEATAYELVAKGHFDVVDVLGKRRVTKESFERWYASQTDYRTVEGSGTGCRYYGIHLRSAGNGKNAWGTSSDHLLYRCQ